MRDARSVCVPYLAVIPSVEPCVRTRPYLARAIVALVVVGVLVGAVLGLRAAVAATGTPVRVVQALPPVAVDGSLSTDPGTIPVGVTAPLSAPLPPVSNPVPSTAPRGVGPSSGPGSSPSGAPTWSPAVDAVPGARGSVIPAAGLSPYSAWAAALSRVIDVPARALQAYGNAQNMVAREQPGCHLSWTTLAGIAHIESNHGRFGGRTLEPDGRPSSAIIGIALDGRPGVQAIKDTDGGVLDGDPVWDHAVGPFQFIPSTWARWKADGNGDGVADPQNIDDAAVAAGRYLCAGGKDLATGAGWWQAILSSNNSVAYVQTVFTGAEAYARATVR